MTIVYFNTRSILIAMQHASSGATSLYPVD
jgi:hypothetical protein